MKIDKELAYERLLKAIQNLDKTELQQTLHFIELIQKL